MYEDHSSDLGTHRKHLFYNLNGAGMFCLMNLLVLSLRIHHAIARREHEAPGFISLM